MKENVKEKRIEGREDDRKRVKEGYNRERRNRQIVKLRER